MNYLIRDIFELTWVLWPFVFVFSLCSAIARLHHLPEDFFTRPLERGEGRLDRWMDLWKHNGAWKPALWAGFALLFMVIGLPGLFPN